MFKTDFQIGGCGGHFGFPIDNDMILSHFDPEVLSLQCKFRLKSTKGLVRDVEN